MTIITKYSIGDVIWFLKNSALRNEAIVRIDTWIIAEKATTTYSTALKDNDGNIKELSFTPEENCFDSKDELINTITERFYESISVQGST